MNTPHDRTAGYDPSQLQQAQHTDKNPANRDPITGEAGSHPVGTTLGAAVAGTAGAIVGSIAGPVGIVVGSALGVAAGGATGHNAAEAMSPTQNVDIEPYLKQSFADRPYATHGEYDDFRPAYAFAARERSALESPRRWDDNLETELRARWEAEPATADQRWEDVSSAVRDAWAEADARIRSYSAENS